MPSEESTIAMRRESGIPALNEVRAQTGSESPEYPDAPEDMRYIVLYPEDYGGHGIDVAGNVALLVTEENAREIKHLAESVIADLSGGNDAK